MEKFAAVAADASLMRRVDAFAREHQVTPDEVVARALEAFFSPAAAAPDGHDATVLSELAGILRSQHLATERLVHLLDNRRRDSERPSETGDTVGSIPRITLRPDRAA